MSRSTVRTARPRGGRSRSGRRDSGSVNTTPARGCRRRRVLAHGVVHSTPLRARRSRRRRSGGVLALVRSAGPDRYVTGSDSQPPSTRAPAESSHASAASGSPARPALPWSRLATAAISSSSTRRPRRECSSIACHPRRTASPRPARVRRSIPEARNPWPPDVRRSAPGNSGRWLHQHTREPSDTPGQLRADTRASTPSRAALVR